MSRQMQWTPHPSVETVDGEPRLKVFLYLKADPSLPKHLVGGMVKIGGKTLSVEDYLRGADGMSSYRRSCSQSSSVAPRGSWWSRLVGWWRRRTRTAQRPPQTFEKMRELLSTHSLSRDLDLATAGLKRAMEKALESGQVALSRRLENEHRSILAEAVLVKNGLFRYLTEKDAVQVLMRADRGVRIDYWNDYPELVPDRVLESKKRADSLRVFDQWCVMHYDPQGSALRQMEVEEWRRDPILFGMMVGSDRLYYVADWKTTTDDLTVDRVCEMLGIERLRDAMDYGGVSEFGQLVQDLTVHYDANWPEDEEMDEPPAGADSL